MAMLLSTKVLTDSGSPKVVVLMICRLHMPKKEGSWVRYHMNDQYRACKRRHQCFCTDQGIMWCAAQGWLVKSADDLIVGLHGWRTDSEDALLLTAGMWYAVSVMGVACGLPSFHIWEGKRYCTHRPCGQSSR